VREGQTDREGKRKKMREIDRQTDRKFESKDVANN
jgi:hypothetical protein